MRKSNFALRLQPSLLAEARKVAKAEGVALNQLINVALARSCRRCAPRAISPNGRRAPTSRRRSTSSIVPGSGSYPSKATNYPMHHRRDAHLREAAEFDAIPARPSTSSTNILASVKVRVPSLRS
jgi:hypothetical protein